MRRGPFVAGADELEEQVGGLGLEGDVADLVDDQQRDAAEPDELVLEAAGVVGVGEPGDPLGGGGECDPVPGLAGADAQPGGQVGFPGAGRAEEHDVVLGGDEVQGAQVGDGLAFEGPLVVEVEVLQGLAGGEPGGADAALAAVGLPGGDLALQARGQELLVGPGLGAGPLGQPVHRPGQRRGLQRAGEVGDLRGHVPARCRAGSSAGITPLPGRRCPGSGRSRPGPAAARRVSAGRAVTRRRAWRSCAAAAAWAGSVMLWCAAQHRGCRATGGPAQVTVTSSSPAAISTVRPITDGIAPSSRWSPPGRSDRGAAGCRAASRSPGPRAAGRASRPGRRPTGPRAGTPARGAGGC